jgi:GNAT superfamily N-acetyltransferase
MTAVVTIRAAKAEDAPAMAGLCGQLGYPSATDEVGRRLAVLLARPDHAVFVAEREGVGVVGWVHVYLSPLLERDLQSEIGGLVVDEAHRGLGAGRVLMAQAERWTAEHGGHAVRLRSNVIRKEAHEFYRRLGYEDIKTSHTFHKPIDTGPRGA